MRLNAVHKAPLNVVLLLVWLLKYFLSSLQAVGSVYAIGTSHGLILVFGEFCRLPSFIA